VLAWSIVPALSEKVLSALGEDAPIPAWPASPGADLLRAFPAARPIAPIGPLVTKLGASDIARLSQRFGGQESKPR
jgi:methionyl-tRNA synthetase